MKVHPCCNVIYNAIVYTDDTGYISFTSMMAYFCSRHILTAAEFNTLRRLEIQRSTLRKWPFERVNCVVV